MNTNELKTKVTKMWREAFLKGTDKAWKSYQTKLDKLANEVNASSPEALENWALRR